MNLVVGFVFYYCKIDIMECFVEDGKVNFFLGFFMRGVEWGCMEVRFIN